LRGHNPLESSISTHAGTVQDNAHGGKRTLLILVRLLCISPLEIGKGKPPALPDVYDEQGGSQIVPELDSSDGCPFYADGKCIIPRNRYAVGEDQDKCDQNCHPLCLVSLLLLVRAFPEPGEEKRPVLVKMKAH